MKQNKRIIIVEDDYLIADYLSGVCEDMGAEVIGVASNADDAISLILANRPDYVLMDVRLKGARDGVDVAWDVHDMLPATKVIFVTGSNEPPTLARIHEDHPYRILIKPIAPEDLQRAMS